MANANDSIPSACDKCGKDFDRPREPLVPAEPRAESESVCDDCKNSSRASDSFVLTSSAESDGTHRFDAVAIAPASVVRCFGAGFEGDGYKVSRQWVFRRAGLIFTVYDWKSTSLYDPDFWNPDELWQSVWPFDLHIGSKHPATEKDVAEFIAYLQRVTST
jgi:hypothetical protein